jgi:hypothetical protein
MLIGNGGGGTSFTQRRLTRHSKIECLFEAKLGGGEHAPEAETEHYIKLRDDADSRGMVWGNKIPIEQFETRRYSDDDIVSLSDHFFVIWLRRRWSRYFKQSHAHHAYYRGHWDRAGRVYWMIREKCPENIIQVSWEDLLLRPVIELVRICAVLGVDYEPEMNDEAILTEKI